MLLLWRSVSLLQLSIIWLGHLFWAVQFWNSLYILSSSLSIQWLAGFLSFWGSWLIIFLLCRSFWIWYDPICWFVLLFFCGSHSLKLDFYSRVLPCAYGSCVSPMLSSSSFNISILISRCLIHSYFIIVQSEGDRSRFILLHVDDKFFAATFVKESPCSPMCIIDPFVKNR